MVRTGSLDPVVTGIAGTRLKPDLAKVIEMDVSAVAVVALLMQGGEEFHASFARERDLCTSMPAGSDASVILPRHLAPMPRRRHRTVSGKARIIAESFAPGASLRSAAMRHCVARSTLSEWRALAREGRLGPVAEVAVPTTRTPPRSRMRRRSRASMVRHRFRRQLPRRRQGNRDRHVEPSGS